MKPLEQLEKIEDNINICRKRIEGLKTVPGPYYKIFNKQDELERLIEVTQKCLEFWQRKHIRTLQLIPSVRRMSNCLRQIGECLQDKSDRSIVEVAWMLEIKKLVELNACATA